VGKSDITDASPLLLISSGPVGQCSGQLYHTRHRLYM